MTVHGLRGKAPLSSARGMMTRPVIIDDNASENAQPAKTYNRADETPVISENTTNMFKGTRKSADNW